MKITNIKEFGLAIKYRRKELGYTQKDVSEYTGYSISFLSELENGKETAEIGRAFIIANLLGLDIEVNGRG